MKTSQEQPDPRRGVTVWYGKLADAEPYPDIQYWRSRSDEEVFNAAWQMVVEAYALKGEDLSESRLQRSVAALLRRGDLIRNKEAVGRPQDLADAEKLRATKESD